MVQGGEWCNAQRFGNRHHDWQLLDRQGRVGTGSTVRMQRSCFRLGRLVGRTDNLFSRIVVRRMMSKMLRSSAGFVLAILCHDAPAKLQHHDCYQSINKPASHRKSIARRLLQSCRHCRILDTMTVSSSRPSIGSPMSVMTCQKALSPMRFFTCDLIDTTLSGTATAETTTWLSVRASCRRSTSYGYRLQR